MKKNIQQKGNIHLVIIITASIAVVIILAFVIWKNFLQPKTVNNSSKQAATQVQATSSIDQVAEWNTYNSTKYGFKLRYPKSLTDVTDKLKPTMPTIAAFDENKNLDSGDPQLKISQYDSTLSAKDFAAANTTGEIYNKKELTINKLAAYEQTTVVNSKRLKTIYFSNGKQIIAFSSPSTSVESRNEIRGDSTIDGTVNTFKFTK